MENVGVNRKISCERQRALVLFRVPERGRTSARWHDATMMERRRVTPKLAPMLALTLILTTFLPEARAGIASNEATVTAGDGSAAAVCQLLVLVRAVIILDLEDSLGLAAAPSERRLEQVLTPESVTREVEATCDIMLHLLRVVVPPGEAVRARSYITGPPSVAPETSVAENKLTLTTSSESAVAVCQYILLIDSVIIAGGAYDLPTVGSIEPHLMPTGGGKAGCSVELGRVEIIESSDQ